MAHSAALCGTPIKGDVIRVIKLDSCGVPVTGASSAFGVFDAYTQMEVSPQYEDGVRFFLRKANGGFCVNQKDASFLNWVQNTLNLCTLDPRVLSMMTGNGLFTSSGTGTGVAFDDDLLSQHYSLEIWQPLGGAGACGASGQQYIYWAFPNNFDSKVQNFTIQNGTFTFNLQTLTQKAASNWLSVLQASSQVTVPWLGAATAMPDTSAGTHFLFNITSTAPPATTSVAQGSCGVDSWT